MEYFNRTGKMAVGSRLRLLTDTITEDASQIYKMYRINMQPKWFPVLYALSANGPMTITDIAKEIGHSHPSVSKITAELAQSGYIKDKEDKSDGRRNTIQLSAKGKEMMKQMEKPYEDVTNAIEELSAHTRNDLWKAIEEWEYLLAQKSLFTRVREQKKNRESNEVQIVDYLPKYKKAFKALNEEWIRAYFKMETTDLKALDNPKGYVLDKGGYILFALYDDVPVGVCALIKMNDPEYGFEMAKMAVSPRMQGKGIGELLGKAIIQRAKEKGALKLYLESNTILKPAISLYEKLGFKKVAGRPTPYERSNIQMELLIK
jgi:DNA-binding MarR family transcriptional regulator